jgi:Transposase, Mutator family
VQARLEDDAQCLLVIIGATPDGKKEFVGLIDGVRESTQSWQELLLDLKRRGLAMAPELAVADGALGFWQAIEKVWPKTRGQRCWVHKTANVLNKLPKSQHSKAKRALQEIWMAETKRDALAAFDAFVETRGVKFDKAVECLIKDRDALLAFYDFPAEHWKHLRTTNVIESAIGDGGCSFRSTSPQTNGLHFRQGRAGNSAPSLIRASAQRPRSFGLVHFPFASLVLTRRRDGQQTQVGPEQDQRGYSRQRNQLDRVCRQRE